MKATFNKSERLCKKKSISDLFTQGSKDFCYPYKMLFVEREKEDDSHAKILVSVPKKYFKHAYQRNRLKRLTREAYRLNKSGLMSILQREDIHCAISFIYVGKEIHEYSFIEKRMKELLKRLCNHYEEGTISASHTSD